MLSYSVSDFIMFSDSVYAEMLRLYSSNTWPMAGFFSLATMTLLWVAGFLRSALYKRVFLFFLAFLWIIPGVLFFQGPFADIAWYGHWLMLVCLLQGSVIAILTTESYRPWKRGVLWPVLLTPIFILPLETVLLEGVGEAQWLLFSPQILNLSLITLCLPFVLQLSATRALMVCIGPLIFCAHFFIVYLN